MVRFGKALLTAFFLAGFSAAAIWLATAHKSWHGVMFERKIKLEEEVSRKTLIKAWEQVQGLDRTFLPGRHFHLPGLVAQLVIMDDGLPIHLRAEALVSGKESTLNTLAREPADAHAWARLAMFRHMENGPSPAVVSALRMSIYAAPAMKSLVFWRIRMAGLCYVHWDPKFETLVIQQILLAQRISPRKLDKALSGTNMELWSGEP
ncbi:MAG: hypothetical protein ACQEQ7_15080 [Thermodesulfobacteriota bacterium]